MALRRGVDIVVGTPGRVKVMTSASLSLLFFQSFNIGSRLGVRWSFSIDPCSSWHSSCIGPSREEDFRSEVTKIPRSWWGRWNAEHGFRRWRWAYPRYVAFLVTWGKTIWSCLTIWSFLLTCFFLIPFILWNHILSKWVLFAIQWKANRVLNFWNFKSAWHGVHKKMKNSVRWLQCIMRFIKVESEALTSRARQTVFLVWVTQLINRTQKKHNIYGMGIKLGHFLFYNFRLPLHLWSINFIK